MSKDSNELRADIAQTRDELRNDVDAIVDKVSPSHIAHRQTARIKDSVSRVKETVMGRSEDVSERTQQAAHDASDAVHEAPQKVAEQTRGNPLAAGLIAFGAGLLACAVLLLGWAEYNRARFARVELRSRRAPVDDVAVRRALRASEALARKLRQGRVVQVALDDDACPVAVRGGD